MPRASRETDELALVGRGADRPLVSHRLVELFDSDSSEAIGARESPSDRATPVFPLAFPCLSTADPSHQLKLRLACSSMTSSARQEPARRQTLDRAATLAAEPALEPTTRRRVALYERRSRSSSGLWWRTSSDASARGALVLNHARVIDFLRDGDRILERACATPSRDATSRSARDSRSSRPDRGSFARSRRSASARTRAPPHEGSPHRHRGRTTASPVRKKRWAAVLRRPMAGRDDRRHHDTDSRAIRERHREREESIPPGRGASRIPSAPFDDIHLPGAGVRALVREEGVSEGQVSANTRSSITPSAKAWRAFSPCSAGRSPRTARSPKRSSTR